MTFLVLAFEMMPGLASLFTKPALGSAAVIPDPTQSVAVEALK